MTVEELIAQLQKIENKKSCVKVAMNPYGCLKYEAIQDVRIADNQEKETVIEQQNLRYFTDNGYVVIEGGGRGE
jgi:hypothetical protein